MIKKILNKNLNFFRHYGVLGALRLYVRAAVWYLMHILPKKASGYKQVKVNDYQMYIDLKDRGISKALFIYGTRENDQMYMIRDILKRGMDVLDIGANIGYYVIFESKIISFIRVPSCSKTSSILQSLVYLTVAPVEKCTEI